MIGEYVIAAALIASAAILSGTALHIAVKVDKNGDPYPTGVPMSQDPHPDPRAQVDPPPAVDHEPVPLEEAPRRVERNPTPVSDDQDPEQVPTRRRGV